MKIILNGNIETIEKDLTIKKFIEKLSLEKNINLSGAVILVNDELIKKENWSEKIIKENESLEVLSFVSGG